MVLRMGKFGIVIGLIVLLGEVSAISEGEKMHAVFILP